MKDLQQILTKVLDAVKPLGLNNITPVVLNDAGNLIVHLVPYPLIARIAKMYYGNNSDFGKDVLERELRVARYLSARGIPVVPCSSNVPPGPYQVDDIWMTLWEYISPYTLPALKGEEVIDKINQLSEAMGDYVEELPVLGVWGNVSKAAEFLEAFTENDMSIANVLLSFKQVDKNIRSLGILIPAHGDAHPRNLIASSAGWLWNDFEDVSLMPKFWDLASFIGNSALFHGLKYPVVDYVLTRDKVVRDKDAFQFALKARVLMSTISNLAMALSGNGDLDFAYSQLERINDFLDVLDSGGL